MTRAGIPGGKGVTNVLRENGIHGVPLLGGAGPGAKANTGKMAADGGCDATEIISIVVSIDVAELHWGWVVGR